VPSFRLTLEYDGTEFEGWQSQAAGRRTVQGALAAALAELAGGGAVRVTGAGRTDAGVHAEGQVAAATLDTRLDAETLLRALNARLPRDVAVVACAAARDGFDPRREARAKLYRYDVWNAPAASPLRRRRFHHVREPLDVAAMKEAAAHLVGRHDFTSFRAAGSPVRDSVRTLARVEVAGAPGAEVRFEVEGDGFLRHMVRNLVGTLLEVGLGRRAPASLPALLEARDRGQVGPTAPARGLTLVRVDY
jgi:tRNA pseudouridine38-40 synthase